MALTKVKRDYINTKWDIKYSCPKLKVPLDGYLYDDDFMASFYDFYYERFIDIDFWQRVQELRDYNTKYVEDYQTYIQNKFGDLGTYNSQSKKIVNSKVQIQNTKGVQVTMNNNQDFTALLGGLQDLQKDYETQIQTLQNDIAQKNKELAQKDAEIQNLKQEKKNLGDEKDNKIKELTEENEKNQKIIANVTKLCNALKDVEKQYKELVAGLNSQGE